MASIVLIDDDRALRNDLADKISDWGHRVRQAGSIDDGQAAIEKYRPDLVLCDINMPFGSGFTLFERLGDRAIRYPGMCFIFISAVSNPRAVAYGLSGGAEDFITKPIDYKQLRSVIDTNLEKKAGSVVSKVLRLFAPRSSSASIGASLKR